MLSHHNFHESLSGAAWEGLGRPQGSGTTAGEDRPARAAFARAYHSLGVMIGVQNSETCSGSFHAAPAMLLILSYRSNLGFRQFVEFGSGD